MSATQDIAYRVVSGYVSDDVLRLMPEPEIHSAVVGHRLVGSMYVCPSKQECIDYYAGVSVYGEGVSEYILTLDCTGMRALHQNPAKSKLREFLVVMPQVMEIEEIDTLNMSKLRACPGCPFAKSCKSGELGGSSVETYIGQIIGPFFLPCHEVSGYQGNDTQLHTCKRQCVGAAVFRANIGVAKHLPNELLRLPEGSDPNVFGTLDEFVAHHRPDLSRAERSDMLSKCELYLLSELRKKV